MRVASFLVRLKETSLSRIAFSSRRRFVALATTCAAAALLPLAGHAQAAWPTKPVRVVVPFSAGGTTDILARAVAQELTRTFGQSFIVDNKPGAGGNIGADMVARLRPTATRS